MPSQPAQPLPSVDSRVSLTPLAGAAALHVVLALLLRVAPVLGLAHALACLVVGVAVAVRRPLRELTYVVAYIAGAEVLWRMSGVPIFWEFAKYAISLIIFVGLLRQRGSSNRGLAAGYLLLLLPSSLLTVVSFGLDVARQRLSFNLSGPLTLALCVLFFSNIRLTRSSLRGALLSLIMPLVGIGTIALVSTLTAKNLQFFGDSNAIVTGGFGPNQVSAVLGLGMLFVLLMVLDRGLARGARIPLLVVAVIFAAEAALTFSRGGITLAFASAFCALFYLVRDARTRITMLVVGLSLFLVGKYVVVPQLEIFTAGKLSERYSSIDPSGRSDIAYFDLLIFADHPILGVGPGAASELREELGRAGVAHTEYTRMLSEHGIFGALAIVALLVLCWRTFRRARTLETRAFVVALLVWGMLFMLINAMRLSAPAFVLGLACAIANSSDALSGALSPVARVRT